jgi:glycosyltransferase involved in cell wall biosynthesis
MIFNKDNLKMSDNLFSIIIPTRQRYDTLKYTIHSVINQTYKEFELIVMDNFSSPETAEVVASFADRKIKYYRAPQRLSMSDNWEMRLSHATGEYMFILGDDDALMPDGLELAEKLISEYAVDILSWRRYSYGWTNVIVPWVRNRLYLCLSQVETFLNSREKLKQFYNYQLSHEYLPMIYNSFVHKVFPMDFKLTAKQLEQFNYIAGDMMGTFGYTETEEYNVEY